MVGFPDSTVRESRDRVRSSGPERVAMAVTGHVTRTMFDRCNIVSKDDLRMAAQKTTLYADTLPTRRTLSNSSESQGTSRAGPPRTMRIV
jgi:hypothetical protein